jgi:hypothetical protein
MSGLQTLRERKRMRNISPKFVDPTERSEYRLYAGRPLIIALGLLGAIGVILMALEFFVEYALDPEGAATDAIDS